MLRTINRSRFLELFGVQHPWENELTNRGICPTLLGEERVYNLLDHDFQDHVGTAFNVCYDPADLSTVLVSARDGSIRFLVPSVEPIPMALADHTPATRAMLARIEGYKKELGQQAIDRRVNNAEQVRALAGRLLQRPVQVVDITGADNTAAPGPMEEAVVRSYGTRNRSHKLALQEAREQDSLRYDPERSAEEQF